MYMPGEDTKDREADVDEQVGAAACDDIDTDRREEECNEDENNC